METLKAGGFINESVPEHSEATADLPESASGGKISVNSQQQ
jgi:hypothetical protein